MNTADLFGGSLFMQNVIANYPPNISGVNHLPEQDFLASHNVKVFSTGGSVKHSTQNVI